MKKFHYLTIVAIAGVLSMTGCRRGNTTTSSVVPSTTSQPTTSTQPTSTTSSGDPVVEDKVISVTVTPEKATIKPGKSTTLKATVKVEGSASTEVLWKSSDESIAMVTAKGVVTGLSAGTVVVTAVAIGDTTKSACAVITVEDTGFAPMYIDEGFTYRKDFPEDEIREFIGGSVSEEDYDIVEPYAAIGYGCYTYLYPGDEDYVSQYIIHLKGETTLSYRDQLVRAGWTQMSVEVDEENIVRQGEFVDPTKTYTIMVVDGYDYDEDYNYFFNGESDMYFFRSSDIWGSSEVTTDTKWDEDKLYASAEYYVEASMLETIQYVPFVALGEDYDFAPKTEIYWFWEIPVANSLIIYDYSLNDTLLENYGAALSNFGYEQLDENTYAGRVNDYSIMYVTFGWTTSGNTITLEAVPDDMVDFPTSYIDVFTEYEVESIYKVPSYTATKYLEDVYYNYNQAYAFDYIEDEETYEITILGIYSYATVNINNAYKYDVVSYMTALEQADYDVVVDDSYLAEYGELQFYAQKGRIVLQGTLSCDYDEVTWDYYDYGVFTFSITSDEEGEETPIEFPVSSIDVAVGAEFLLTPTLYVSGLVDFVSSNPSVATISDLGEVEALAEGSTVITATLHAITGGDYDAQITINVKPVAEGVTISGGDTVSSGKTAQYEAVATPAGSAFSEAPVWSIELGSQYATIDQNGLLTAGEVEEEQKVRIKVDVDGFTATKEITITPEQGEVTETFTFTSKAWEDSTSTFASIKDGAGFNVQQTAGGVQVTANFTGAGCLSNIEFDSVSKVVITYATNSSKGQGSIDLTIGESSMSLDVSKEGGTSQRTLEFDLSGSCPSGYLSMIINCTQNSIYIFSIEITHC